MFDKSTTGLVALAVAIVALLMISGCEDGSYFDSNTKQIKSDAVSRIEATGEDLRAYEFTPRTDATMQCVFVAGDRKAGLHCWKRNIE